MLPEVFVPGPQIDLTGPRRAGLPVQSQYHLRNVIRVRLWSAIVALLTLVNVGIDDQVYDVNSLGPQLASQHLRQAPLAELPSHEVQVTGAP